MKNSDPKCESCHSRAESIFCHISDQSIEDLDQNKITKIYKRGTFLYQEGGTSEGVFCLRSGKVKLSRSGDEGKEVILGIASAGDVLGFRSVLADAPYHRNAEIIEDAQICFIRKEFFGALIQKNPSMAFEVIRKMADELETTEHRISDFLNITAKTRFMRLLLMLEKAYGVKDSEGIILEVRLTRQEMGEMIGAATETVIRILSDLETAKIVCIEGKRIKIIDPKKLLSLANMEL